MKSKLLYGAAFSALLLTACSQDSVIDSPEFNENAISFAVNNGGTTRGEQSFCNTSMPASFTVSAYRTSDGENYKAGDAYFVKDKATRVSENGTSYVSNPERYWPQGTLTFHAWLNDQGTYSYDEAGMHFNNFKPAAEVGNQKDLIYAVAADQSKKSEAVKLNFRHPLCQIVYSARNEARSYNVSISGVTVGHLNNQGSYLNNLKTSTDQNYENHTWDQNNEEYKILKGQGEWTLNGVLTNYNVGFDAMEIPSQTVALTDVDHKGNSDGSMLLLPQKQAKWNPSAQNQVEKENGFNGSYFLLDVVFTDANNSSEIYKGQIAVPVEVSWEQGYRYRYTFVFTEGGNGGWTPDPDNPQPILLGVKYDVQVDDFVPVINPDINTGDNPNGGGQGETKTTYSYTVKDGDNILASGSYTGTVAEWTFDGINVDNPKKEGAEFLGWRDSRTGELVAKVPQVITLKKGENTSVVFTAEWKEVAKYTYTLNFNINNPSSTKRVVLNGKEIDGIDSMTVTTTAESYTFTIPNYALLIPDTKYTFLGWTNTPADMIGADTEYVLAGEEITLTKNNPTITLNAGWSSQMIGGGTPGAGGSGYNKK